MLRLQRSCRNRGVGQLLLQRVRKIRQRLHLLFKAGSFDCCSLRRFELVLQLRNRAFSFQLFCGNLILQLAGVRRDAAQLLLQRITIHGMLLRRRLNLRRRLSQLRLQPPHLQRLILRSLSSSCKCSRQLAHALATLPLQRGKLDPHLRNRGLKNGCVRFARLRRGSSSLPLLLQLQHTALGLLCLVSSLAELLLSFKQLLCGCASLRFKLGQSRG